MGPKKVRGLQWAQCTLWAKTLRKVPEQHGFAVYFGLAFSEVVCPPPEADDLTVVRFDKVKKVKFKRVAHDAKSVISPMFQENTFLCLLVDSELRRPQLGDPHVKVDFPTYPPGLTPPKGPTTSSPLPQRRLRHRADDSCHRPSVDRCRRTCRKPGAETLAAWVRDFVFQALEHRSEFNERLEGDLERVALDIGEDSRA